MDEFHVAPITIQFMLACYAISKPQEYLGLSHWDSPAGKETRSWLIDNDLITQSYRATDRGKAWVQYICNTPLPIQTWTLPSRD